MKLPKGELKPVIRLLFKKKKDWTNDQLYALYPDENQSSLRGYRAEFTKPDNNNSNNVITTQKKTKTPPMGKNSRSPGKPPVDNPSIDITLLSMNDVEQCRHLYKQVICRTNIDIRVRLKAAEDLANLKDKQGEINTETKSEKEVMNKFRQQSTDSLVAILKKSSLKER